MLAPFLLVGVGGSGGKTLRAVRQYLDSKLRLRGWTEGIPAAWQFLHFDTPLSQDGVEFPAPFLPQESYIGLATSNGTYSMVINAIESQVPKEQQSRLLRQLPNPNEVTVDVQKGAGQFRAIGRAVALARLNQVGQAAKASYARMTNADSISQLARLSEVLRSKGSAKSKPVFLVVSSVAGGSGAGQYLDIVDAIKAQFPSTPWVNNNFGLLYAPDVFDGISGAAGVPSNALATISESTNGAWNNVVDESVRAAFLSQGLTVQTGDPDNRVGVKYPLIVGREGSTTSFAGQHDVYLSIASTISAWMTEDLFRDNIDAYMSANWQANTLRDMLPDNLGLAASNQHVPPFAAVGFGRITLARDKFVDYAKERFARSCMERLLRAHVIDSRDPNFERNDNEGYLRESANTQRVSFFSDSGFDEESMQHDQVIDALRGGTLPDARAGLKQEFMNAVAGEVAVDRRSGGLTPEAWVEGLAHARNGQVSKFLQRDLANRSVNYQTWIAEAPRKLLEVVGRYSIEFGIPVTERLLHELSQSVERAATELDEEASSNTIAVGYLASYLTEEMKKAGQANVVRPGSDALLGALEVISESLDWECEAGLKSAAANVLREARQDFIEPLRGFLASTLKAMQEITDNDRTPDGRENEFKRWPAFDSREVPKKFEPASNEKMLIDVKEFPDKFEELVRETVKLPDFLPAFRSAMREVLSENSTEKLSPILEFREPWVPGFRIGEGSQQQIKTQPSFSMPNNPDNFLERAETWMKRQGSQFGGFIKMTLTDYLDYKTLQPDEFNRRKDKFLSEFRAALSASRPLVKLDATLMNQVHNKTVDDQKGTQVLITPIPFTAGMSELYDPTREILVNILGDDAQKAGTRFTETPQTSIEIFQIMEHGVLPIVISSVMAPIANAWAKVNKSSNSRSAFWQWKRARLIHEAVPMDSDALSALISGWYLARAFAQIQLGESAELGPKLAVKDSEGQSLFFPHPLLYVGELQSFDFLGAIVESSIIAQALANSNSSLSPIRPYQRLIELAGVGKIVSPEVRRWIFDGVALKTPATSTSLSNKPEATAGVDARKSLLIEFLKEEIKQLDSGLATLKTGTSIYDQPVVWELAPLIRMSVNDLMASINRLESDSLPLGVEVLEEG